MIINVTALIALNGGNEICVCIETSEGEFIEKQKFTILADQFLQLKIKKGQITTAQFDEIELASKICSAYKKGLFLLGYGACSEKKLHYKLKSKGFDSDISSEAVNMLAKNGFINEEDNCQREIEICLSKLWGKKRIIAHLYAKGFSEHAVKAGLAVLEDIDFVENCKELILRNYKRQLMLAKEDKAKSAKLCSALQRMGYSFSEIKEASAGITAD